MDVFLYFAVFSGISLFAIVTFPRPVRSKTWFEWLLCLPSTANNNNNNSHDETITKVTVAVPAVAKRSFRRVSHVYMCSVTADPEVYESVTFLQSREETTASRFVPPRVVTGLLNYSS